MAKSMLIICQQAPWSNSTVKETLDLALAGGAFDLPISLLFLEDGVFQLVKNQQPQTIEQKNITSNLQALPLFGITEIFVVEQHLYVRGLNQQQLLEPVKLVQQEELNSLLVHYDTVITS